LFATHAAIAIENARLHSLANEREREAAVIAERERVVREVHDTVGRGLAAVVLRLDAADRAVTDARDPRSELAEAKAAARSALSETQRTVLGLGPSLLDGRSLSDSLALELAWVESTAGVATRLILIGEPQALAPETAHQLFRIVQESLTNVVEHADAHQVRVGLVYGGETTTVIVEDDGRGFDVAALTATSAAAAPATAFGLQGLASRAQHLGGTLQVESTPQWGTRIRAEVPYSPTAQVGSARSRWRVLVVHESPVVRAGLVRLLSNVEPEIQVVGEVGDAGQAVEAYELLRPHVVLAHLDLPHIDGVQLTSYLRAVDPDASVVLLIHGLDDERVRGAARIGAVGFVEHEAEPGDLARAVVAAARGDSLMTADFLSRFAATLTDEAGDHLTAREKQVRALVERGYPDKRIAADLEISVKTVEKHVSAILRKTGAANRTMLAGRSALHPH
jgi:DNA-binding NarL/FixJ family response regulator/two-component sensor histidine kinase